MTGEKESTKMVDTARYHKHFEKLTVTFLTLESRIRSAALERLPSL